MKLFTLILALIAIAATQRVEVDGQSLNSTEIPPVYYDNYSNFSNFTNYTPVLNETNNLTTSNWTIQEEQPAFGGYESNDTWNRTYHYRNKTKYHRHSGSDSEKSENRDHKHRKGHKRHHKSGKHHQKHNSYQNSEWNYEQEYVNSDYDHQSNKHHGKHKAKKVVCGLMMGLIGLVFLGSIICCCRRCCRRRTCSYYQRRRAQQQQQYLPQQNDSVVNLDNSQNRFVPVAIQQQPIYHQMPMNNPQQPIFVGIPINQQMPFVQPQYVQQQHPMIQMRQFPGQEQQQPQQPQQPQYGYPILNVQNQH